MQFFILIKQPIFKNTGCNNNLHVKIIHVDHELLFREDDLNTVKKGLNIRNNVQLS